MEYTLKKGGHRDLHRIYPMMAFDYGPAELIGEFYLQQALVGGDAEILLLKDGAGYEAGYAFVIKKSVYGYVFITYFSVYPNMRGRGAGAAFLTLAAGRYAGTQGVFLKIGQKNSETDRFLSGGFELGWRTVSCRFRIAGRDAALLCLPLAGPEDVSPAAPLIVSEMVGRVLPEGRLGRFLSIERL